MGYFGPCDKFALPGRLCYIDAPCRWGGYRARATGISIKRPTIESSKVVVVRSNHEMCEH